MPVDINSTLKNALQQLNVERARIDRQIAALARALQETEHLGPAMGRIRPGPVRRKGMSVAARKAVSARMKAYWAQRRAKQTKAAKKRTPGKRKSNRSEGPNSHEKS